MPDPAATPTPTPPHAALERVLGPRSAVLLGLGSILGTGAFVGLAVAAGVAGASVVLATALAAGVATCNGLSSAQLAAAFPTSGGTYEYGHRTLTPTLGFVAGWTFLCAKSASAATAALGFAGYALAQAGVESAGARTAVAVGLVVAVTALVAGGLRRSNAVNAALVALTVLGLLAFVAAAAPAAARQLDGRLLAALRPEGPGGLAALAHGTALMFVAYTGYGRIATLGEEVRDPARTIPRAIVATLALTAVLYVGVALVAVAAVGAPALHAAGAGGAAPLAELARALSHPALATAVSVAAVLAMAGVLLNLLLGLSRVALAMARRRDLPGSLAAVEGGSPRRAVLAVGAVTAALALAGDVRATWSLSAFAVLVYYALTNLAALRLPRAQRRLPRAVAVLGLASCAGLAPFVDPSAVGAGAALVAVGLAGRAVARARRAPG